MAKSSRVRAPRSSSTWPTKSSAEDEPPPIQPSAMRAARRSAGGALAPNQTGSGCWSGLGSQLQAVERRRVPRRPADRAVERPQPCEAERLGPLRVGDDHVRVVDEL